MNRQLFIFLFTLLTLSASAQWKPFRFAFISDTHIGSPDGLAEEDLRRTVADINSLPDIAFVVITGDITELGMDTEITLAKKILDGLTVPYYIIPGNHDSGWSESGGVSFGNVFGGDKFNFTYNGIHFLGCASGPYVRMGDGHIPRDAVIWMEAELQKIGPDQPVIFLNHYPITNALDNWYDALNLLQKHNTLAILCGHGHNNHTYNFEGIPGIMGRSNLRAKAAYGGYNLVNVSADSLVFSERKPGINTLKPWARVALRKHVYDPTKKYDRPSYSVNDSFPQVKQQWTFHADANVISTPAVVNKLAIFGNSKGTIQALSMIDGKKQWSYPTGGAIYSSPAVSGNRIVLGSGDGNIYCLSADKGKLLWQLKTGAAVLGCPLIEQQTVFIGGSDHHFRALDLASGKELWQFDGLDGPVVSTPVLEKGVLLFGAWDRHLYALDAKNGHLIWKWNNGAASRNLSPAACTPVVANGVVYVVAPDRYLSAIDLQNGKTLWRSKEATVRESIGISEDKKYIYAKTMQDTVVAFKTSREWQPVDWKLDCGFGYEHVPSMLVEKEGLLFFGTKNGRVYCIDPVKKKRVWVNKIDNSMVNTVRVIDARHLLAATMDGKISLLVTK